MRPAFFSMLVFCTVLGAMAENSLGAESIYRWVDDAGVVHFSNRPPTGVDAEVVNMRTLRSGSNAPGSAAAEGEAEISVAEQRRQERAELRRKFSEAQRKLEAECEIMRRQRESVISRPSVLVAEADGTTRRLGDDERLEMLNEAESFLAENCD